MSSTSSSPALDVGRAVREGESLDVDAIDAWLKPRVDGLTGIPVVTQFSGGASNWTYRLQYPSHDLILRRPPKGTKAKSAHDMGREHRVQAALRTHFAPVPEMIAFCDDDAVIGAEFYVMRRVEGFIPRAKGPWPFDPTTTRKMGESFVDTWVALHTVDYNAAGLATLGKGEGYCRRQVDGWSGRYDKARTWNVPKFTRVKAWLDERTPTDVAQCVIHGDFRLDNVVVDPNDPTRILAVLDWELSTIGDPLMDVGSSLAYWIESDDGFVARKTKRQPTDVDGMLTRRELVARYRDKMGFTSTDMTFYEVFGLFRLAGIAQQIYFRYHKGQTRNPAFKNIWIVVHHLERRCLKLMRGAAT